MCSILILSRTNTCSLPWLNQYIYVFSNQPLTSYMHVTFSWELHQSIWASWYWNQTFLWYMHGLFLSWRLWVDVVLNKTSTNPYIPAHYWETIIPYEPLVTNVNMEDESWTFTMVNFTNPKLLFEELIWH